MFMISALDPRINVTGPLKAKHPPAHAWGSPGLVSIAALILIWLTGCTDSPATHESHDGGAPKPRDQITIAMLPKLTNIAYFRACEEGAKKAAAELGVRLVY